MKRQAVFFLKSFVDMLDGDIEEFSGNLEQNTTQIRQRWEKFGKS